MSLKIEGCSCAHCHAYLFSDDDVVFCPVCGAPHHRECYKVLGHCAVEELHGTENEYSREKELEAISQKQKEDAPSETRAQNTDGEDLQTKTCPVCSKKYDINLNRCPECRTPDISNISGYETFDFLGGVPAEQKISENVTAGEARRFVLANTQRYIPKFVGLKTRKVSWNWMAFLFPTGWMLSRKMIKNGVITGFLTIIATLLSIPFSHELMRLGFSGVLNADSLAMLFDIMPSISLPTYYLALFSSFLIISIRVLSGLFGDYLYKKYTVESITQIKSSSKDIDFSYRKKGGVDIFLFFIGTMMVQYIPQILTLLI